MITKVYNGKPYLQVSRKANVGELIMVISTNWHAGKAGDVFAVTDADHLWGGQFRKGTGVTVKVGNKSEPIYHHNYVVLEPVEQPVELKSKQPETLSGVQYVLSDGKARKGDLIQIVGAYDTSGFYKNGDVLKVANAESDGIVYVDFPKCEHYVILKSEYKLLKQPTQKSSREIYLEETIAELQSELDQIRSAK